MNKRQRAPQAAVAAVIVGLMVLAGCGPIPVAQVPRIQVLSKFDEADAYLRLLPGPNTIKGNAFMRQRGGGVVTCAGATVYLFPATPYATERMGYIYGFNLDSGSSDRPKKFDPDPPAYYQKSRTTKCDAQGNFVFDQVADGEYFITTVVSWTVANSAQGGGLMQRARVAGGQTVSYILSS